MYLNNLEIIDFNGVGLVEVQRIVNLSVFVTESKAIL